MKKRLLDYTTSDNLLNEFLMKSLFARAFQWRCEASSCEQTLKIILAVDLKLMEIYAKVGVGKSQIN